MADELDVLRRLAGAVDKRLRKYTVLEAYYDGARRLQALGLALPPEMEDLQVIINWPGMYVDSVEERLDVEGFRVGRSDTVDETLWDWWQANGLDEESGLGHLDALMQGRAYTCVGFPEDDGAPPPITVESSRYMAGTWSPRTHRLENAARLWDDNDAGVPQRATLYMPDANIYYGRSERGRGWLRHGIDQHNLGEPLVAALVNRGRLTDRDGVTEMRDIMGLSDAACRSVTNLQGAQEVLALPQRYIVGASEEDFQDEYGNRVPAWEAYLGRYLTLVNDQAKVAQLSGADLRNFTEVLKTYAQLAQGLTGLPAHYWGFSSDNPASADAIRSGESRLVKRAERRQRAFGGGWETTMRLAMLAAGRDPGEAVRLETVWRDPATPTYAARADAVTKQHSAGILPLEAAWEDMGYSVERRRRLRAMMSSDPAERFLATVQQMNQRESAGTGAGPGGGEQ
ncbi:phage portal protein [Nocardiopsis aegyptia]|uniref:phage portal protein n=1 Tax=Nocardiopsis aegyptia TaxID=220378 RepID=UPI00367149E0